jgi:hypothetical protein
MEDADRPATKRDLAALESKLTGQMAALDNKLTGQMAALDNKLTGQMTEMEDRITERIRDSQTEILKAFLPYQEGQNVRLRILENTDTGITERMAVLERRLQEIEKKLLMHPPAA